MVQYLEAIIKEKEITPPSTNTTTKDSASEGAQASTSNSETESVGQTSSIEQTMLNSILSQIPE